MGGKRQGLVYKIFHKIPEQIRIKLVLASQPIVTLAKARAKVEMKSREDTLFY